MLSLGNMQTKTTLKKNALCSDDTGTRNIKENFLLIFNSQVKLKYKILKI